MKKIIFYSLVLLLSINAYSQNLNLDQQPIIWLKANQSTDTINWVNQAGPLFNAVFPANMNFIMDEINFQPTFQFNGNVSPLEINFLPASTQKLKILTVFHTTDSFNEVGIWAIPLDSAQTNHLSTFKIVSSGLRSIYTDTSISYPNINALNQSWKDINIDTNYTKLLVAGTDSLNFNGEFAEFLLFSDDISNEDNEKVHTYLAVKYGITIYLLNYVDHNGNIIWNTEDMSDYNNDVAAIYRNDSLDLYQKQSCGNGGLSELSIYLDSFKELNDSNAAIINDGEYVFWGHNDMPLTEETSDTLDQSIYVTNLLERKWLVKLNGDSLRNKDFNIKLNTSDIDSFSNIALVVNSYENELFELNSSQIYYADSIDTDSNYYFKGINWDIDSSGTDIFGFKILNQIYYSQQITLPNGTSSNDSELEVEILPNPTNAAFKIVIKNAKYNKYNLVLTDSKGIVVDRQNLNLNYTNTFRKEISVKGVYYIHIYNKDEEVIKKVIIN